MNKKLIKKKFNLKKVKLKLMNMSKKRFNPKKVNQKLMIMIKK